jgi:hypothetical protein
MVEMFNIYKENIYRKNIFGRAFRIPNLVPRAIVEWLWVRDCQNTLTQA